MTRLPVVSANDIIKVLEKKGFQILRQRDSHIVLQKQIEGGTLTTVVPNHKEIAHGTMRSILKKTGLSVDELIQLLTLMIGVVSHFW